jgi:hypothetical protein
MLKEPVDTTMMTVIMIMTKIMNNNNNLFKRADTTAWVNNRDGAKKQKRQTMA